MAVLDILELDQELACNLCKSPVWRKAGHNLALTSNVFLALSDMPLDHFDLGLSGAGHPNHLLSPASVAGNEP